MVDDDEAGAGPTQIGPALRFSDAPEPKARPSALGRVLVAEAGHQTKVGERLRRAGYTVEWTDDGVVASQILASQEIDIVLCDIALPGMSGIDLLRHIKEHGPELPVLLMTASPDVESAAAAVEHGAFQYLMHPVRQERLEQVVQRAMESLKISKAKVGALQMMEDLDTVVTASGAEHAMFHTALDQLWMAYQPIVNADGSPYAHEALMRSDFPDLPHPGALLDAAERLNMLLVLGRRVRGLVAEHVETRSEGFFFVNLHPLDLFDDALVDPESPLTQVASRVVLEVTERAALADADDVQARMADLRAVGFRLALDDLGAGYAGLTSFARLRPEVVKLDMELVRNIHKDPVRQKLVRSIVSASCDLGILVVAEGIEAESERDALVEMGCQLLQGYLYGRPQRPA